MSPNFWSDKLTLLLINSYPIRSLFYSCFSLLLPRSQRFYTYGLLLPLVLLLLTLVSGCVTQNYPSSSSVGSSGDNTDIEIEKKKSNAKKLVLFVHGVIGDHVKTWTNRSNISWQQIMRKDDDFNDFDIGSVGYYSPYVSHAASIEDIATQVLQKIEDKGIFDNYEEIYFITHSMGGLIIKRVLIDLNRPKDTKLRKVKAVLYISTPVLGSGLAEIGSWLSLNPQLQVLRPDLNSYLHILENLWQNLMRDRDGKSFPLSFCAYETMYTGLIKVVDRVYTATRCDQNPRPVTVNHYEIAKPESAKADIYLWAKAHIREATLLSSRKDQPVSSVDTATAKPATKCNPQRVEGIDDTSTSVGVGRGALKSTNETLAGVITDTLQSSKTEKAFRSANFFFELNSCGSYEIEVTYANVNADPMILKVDGLERNQAALAQKTKDWNTFVTNNTNVIFLEAGHHTLSLESRTPIPHIKTVILNPR